MTTWKKMIFTFIRVAVVKSTIISCVQISDVRSANGGKGTRLKVLGIMNEKFPVYNQNQSILSYCVVCST